MQIIINRNTIDRAANEYKDLVQTIAGSMDDTVNEKAFDVVGKDLSRNDKKNWSLSDNGETLIINVSDEIFFKHLKMYSKLVSMLLPFVAAIKMAANLFKSEMKSIEDFICEDKEEKKKKEEEGYFVVLDKEQRSIVFPDGIVSPAIRISELTMPQVSVIKYAQRFDTLNQACAFCDNSGNPAEQSVHAVV